VTVVNQGLEPYSEDGLLDFCCEPPNILGQLNAHTEKIDPHGGGSSGVNVDFKARGGERGLLSK
jgi:hypothetical protein